MMQNEKEWHNTEVLNINQEVCRKVKENGRINLSVKEMNVCLMYVGKFPVSNYVKDGFSLWNQTLGPSAFQSDNALTRLSYQCS